LRGVSPRPAVDVVLPFKGTDAALDAVVQRLAAIATRPGDTLTVADNRPGARDGERGGGVQIVGAGATRTSYFARNRAAERGAAPWLVFLDADVDQPADLLDRYFEPDPHEKTGVLAGAVRDEEPDPNTDTAANRYAFLKSSMSQEITLADDAWPFAQTANAAVRREAFAEVGGFEETVRSGGDADLCFRLRAAGWGLERRPQAIVTHRNRATIPRMLAQRARHGAGAGWLARRWPGALPRRRWPGLAYWSAKRAVHGLTALARHDRDEALLGLLDGPAVWAFELGRLIPNRPRPKLHDLIPQR
jgi:hypothetical protein